MRVKVEGVLHDTEKTPVVLVFANTEELKTHIANMQQMVDNPPPPGEASGYAVYPDGTPKEDIWELFAEIQEEIGEVPNSYTNSQRLRKK